MTNRNRLLLAALFLAGASSACATAPPAELVKARNAYEQSRAGLAAKLTPADLHDAQLALEIANAEFEENGDTAECRDQAYIADRKVAIADAKARTELDRQKIAEAVAAGVTVRDRQARTSKAALSESREQLADARRTHTAATTSLMAANALQTSELRATNAAQGKELADTAADLDAEHQARLAAETRLAGAMKDLETVAAVTQEPRGVVITLSGSILFASGQSALLETAKTKLDHVAEALVAQDSSKRMVVEGHTDSRGSARTNEPLSLERATAVRDYLVTRGVPADRISSVGLGSRKPVTDNATSEGRANNRRVEIVISGTSLSGR